MPELKDILPGLRAKHGSQTDVAKELGIRSQLLGQYENGKRNPKHAFYKKWKELYNEDLEAMTDEANDSRETKKPTREQKGPTIKEKPLGDPEVYRTIVEGKTEYLLVPRIQYQKDERMQEWLLKELERYQSPGRKPRPKKAKKKT